ncbi:MAG TPA: hypothetical protein VFT22_26265 [Kofleriaceae bacterium]|nr:hypothetical protein [Kofleriaceae bacterium]
MTPEADRGRLEDRAFVTANVDPRRIIDGMIGFLAYHAPLPGETRFAEPGVAYWFPPAPSPFSGERAGALIAALRRGKLPARRVRLARRVVPLDLETYLRIHFTKFGAQTRAGIQSYLDHGRTAGLSVDAIERLAATAPAG